MSGSFHHKESKAIPLTLEVAQDFRDMKPSPTERELSERRVSVLKDKAEHGKLVTFQWAVAILRGERLRMNGQHSSNMLCQLEGNFPEGLWAHIDEYEVEDSDGLADLFRQFDDRRSARSAKDVCGAYQMLHGNLHDVPRPIAKLAIDGIAWFDRQVRRLKIAQDNQYELFNTARETVHPFVLWMGELHDVKTPELRKSPVSGAMWTTFQTSENKAKVFWHSVARGGEEYQDDDPKTVLDRFLKSLVDKEQNQKRRIKIGAPQVYNGCVYAWNAWRQDRTLTSIRTEGDRRTGWYEPIE